MPRLRPERSKLCLGNKKTFGRNSANVFGTWILTFSATHVLACLVLAWPGRQEVPMGTAHPPLRDAPGRVRAHITNPEAQSFCLAARKQCEGPAACHEMTTLETSGPQRTRNHHFVQMQVAEKPTPDNFTKESQERVDWVCCMVMTSPGMWAYGKNNRTRLPAPKRVKHHTASLQKTTSSHRSSCPAHGAKMLHRPPAARVQFET